MSAIPEIELASIATQTTFQFDKLKSLLAYLQDRSPYYKRLFEVHHISNDSIQSLADLEKIPTTSKEDIQENNFDLLCVPKNQIIEYTATSGTMGAPLTIALSKNDIQRLAYNESLSFGLMQLDAEDIVQFMLTLDRQFMAGMAYYLGLQQNGASAIRTGPGLPAMQFEVMKRLGTTTLVAVPSFIIKLIEYAQKEHIDLSSLPVKKILCIGENIRNEKFEFNALGRFIKTHWNVQLFSTYASTEMQTAFTECEFGNGGHLHPELILTEIIDEDGKTCDPGVYGEVCITHFGVESMPLLRYRTGDICCMYFEPCQCGRTTPRLSAVMGRKKQMIKYKGTTLYPPAVFDMLNQCSFISDYVVEVKSSAIETDDLIIHLSTPLNVDECERKLKPFFQTNLRVIPEIIYKSSHEIHAMQFPEGSRKAIKFIDSRKNQNH